jgi:hypothetical protein
MSTQVSNWRKDAKTIPGYSVYMGLGPERFKKCGIILKSAERLGNTRREPWRKLSAESRLGVSVKRGD